MIRLEQRLVDALMQYAQHLELPITDSIENVHPEALNLLLEG